MYDKVLRFDYGKQRFFSYDNEYNFFQNYMLYFGNVYNILLAGGEN